MDSEQSPSASAGPGSSLRRDRAAIAAQACETCRTRKSKCDEKRPQCSLCKRLNVHCNYREPQPTKKDKTLIEILDSLQRLEVKVDALAPTLDTPSSRTGGSSNGLYPPTLQIEGFDASDLAAVGKYAIEGLTDLRQPYRHTTAAHKVLLWPSIARFLLDSGNVTAADIQDIEREGTLWFHKLDLARHSNSLPINNYLSSASVSPPTQNATIPQRVRFPSLDEETMKRYALQYFNTFNVLFPVLDQEDFWNDHLWRVTQYGFGDQDSSSILCLLVLALGKVANDAESGDPVSYANGFPSGLQGQFDQPPGLEIFNEARKRLGFIVSECKLENVQAMLLTSIYYESCGRHLDFWRLLVSASMSCQVVIKCAPIDWSSPHGDLVRRNYWICNLVENWFHLDLDLPQSGINELEAEVSLPTFGESFKSESPDDERAHVQLPFLSMIAIRRFTTSAHAAIFDATTSKAESMEHYAGPPIHVIAELARQLDDWRAVLPPVLQWTDSERMFVPRTEETIDDAEPAVFSLTPQLDGSRSNYRYNIDISTAHLRTRFYYARFMIYRPFVYKALHFPHLTSMADIECVVTCLESALSWPIIMYPPKAKKRLVPCLFAWTQNSMGILLILRMSLENNLLGRISQERISQRAVEETVMLMLDWLRDAKQEDAVAEWCWNVIQPLYHDLFMPGELN